MWLFAAGNDTYKSPCRSVCPSVGRHLRVGKFVFEHAPAQSIIAPAQSITASAQLITVPAQLITAPAQPPATEVAVYTALLDAPSHL